MLIFWKLHRRNVCVRRHKDKDNQGPTLAIALMDPDYSIETIIQIQKPPLVYPGKMISGKGSHKGRSGDRLRWAFESLFEVVGF